MRHSLSLLALFASSAFAAVDGTNVTWSNYTDMVNNNCTGTVIGGNKVLTAAHCNDIRNSLSTYDEQWIFASSVTAHPDDDGHTSDFDVAFLNLPQRIDTAHIRYFANLNTEPLANGDEVKLYGFAGTANQLSYATMVNNTNPTGIPRTTRYTADKIANGGETQGGDSGGAWLNASNEIIGVHNGGTRDGADTDYTYGINLHTVHEFILSTINGWHYPTIASANGAKTITVQSLHTGGVADSAYTDGNVTITGGTCSGNNAIGEFEKCTYEIEATGEGKLWLTANEYIHINKPAPSTDNGGGGSSGGSMGLFGLLGLFGLGVMRSRKR